MSTAAPRPIVRRTWMVLGSVVSVVLLVYVTLSMVGVLAHEEHTEVATFDEPVEVVDVRNAAGSIEIIGTDTDVVTVTSEISEGLFGSSHSARVEDDRLVVRADCPELALSPWCSITLRIEVPAQVAVTASVEHGSLSVSDVAGPVQATSSHGPVTLARLAGDVTTSTSHGAITGSDLRADRTRARTSHGTVHLTFLDAPALVDVHTSHGAVEVVLPEDSPTYRVDASAGGSVNTQIRTDPDSDFAVVVGTDRGSVTIRYG